MMYEIIISKGAEKDMDKLPLAALKKVAEAIDDLSEIPRPSGCIKLSENNYHVYP